MTFLELGIEPHIARSLEQLSIVEPTPIQQALLPRAIEGCSLVARSQTGSGKTLAYILPIVQALSQQSSARALVVAPTRELAQQIAGVYSSIVGADDSLAVIVGGVDYAPQREILARAPRMIVATPGRLLDLIGQGIEVAKVSHFVLDEVDQMLDLGFREPIFELAKLREDGAQSLCFSATLPPSVEELLLKVVPDSERVVLAGEKMAIEKIEQLGYYVSMAMMENLLLHLLRVEKAEHSIVFTRSRKMADRVVALLKDNNFSAEAMHSDRSQAAREHILSRFRGGETSILVATDVVARGVDIDSVTHVFNYGLPLSAEQYIHRIGRCGRAGRSGRALSLVTPDEKPMVNEICKMMRRHIIFDAAHPYLTVDVTLALDGCAKGQKSVSKSRRRK